MAAVPASSLFISAFQWAVDVLVVAARQ
jgi:hypothetical protein